MQKVLRKRIVRDFKENLSRYLALAFLIMLSMYLVISMIAAAETIIRGSEAADAKQHVEDGQFSLFVPMQDREWNDLTDTGIALEKMFYMDYTITGDKVLRVFRNRESIDEIAIYEGRLAEDESELVLERKFAEKNEIHIGDTLKLGGRTFTVCGIGTVPDYDAPQKSLGDTGCDSLNFGLAFVTADTYEKMKKEGRSTQSEEYYYAYRLQDKMTADALKDKLDDLSFSSDAVQDAYFQEYWDRTVGQKDDLKNGITDLLDGASELEDGLKKLTDNNDTLNDATDSLLDSYLQEANSALSAYGVTKLTKDNFEMVLQARIRTESNAIVKLSLKSLLDDLKDLKAYADGVSEYTDGTKEAADGAVSLREGVQELKDDTDDLIDEIFGEDTSNLLTFLKAEDNVRIQAASGDQELYRSVGTIAGVIILILISYVLSVFVVHAIDRESAVIGALYALGVNKKDLMRHYIMLPTLIAAISGIVGTILAYTDFGVRYQMADCYHYYSLPEMQVIVMPYLVIYGVIVPPLVCYIVTSLVIRKRLSKPVLTLLKNEKKAGTGKHVKLKNMKFMRLFRLRQILRESRTAFTVVFGMFVSLLLGVMALEIYVYCDRVRVQYVEDTHYAYMYTYKYPAENPPEGGYQAYAKTLKKEIYGYTFDVTVMGLTEENPYFDVDLEDSQNIVTISSAISYKYGLRKGDVFTLDDTENNKTYAFRVGAVTQYAPSFIVFMKYEEALDLFGEQDEYYNVVFSDHDLGIEPGRLYATTTKKDVEKAAGIFSDQMQSMIMTIGGVSAVIFAIVLYLMMKVMIDRSSFNIALIKIFGYRNREVKKMYLDGNFYIIVAGALISIPVAKWLMDLMYEPAFVPNIACGVDKSFTVGIYLGLFVFVLVLYFIINHMLVGRIKKMLPAEVLKNRE